MEAERIQKSPTPITGDINKLVGRALYLRQRLAARVEDVLRPRNPHVRQYPLHLASGVQHELFVRYIVKQRFYRGPVLLYLFHGVIKRGNDSNHRTIVGIRNVSVVVRVRVNSFDSFDPFDSFE